jgi:CPA1 family monovalent cation:H+ antiporter
VIGEVDTVLAAELFVALVLVAAVVALVARRLQLPYTVALVVAGLGIAFLVPRIEEPVDPELILAVLLPGLVFEAALKTHVDDLRGSIRFILLLAAPGVVITAAIVAAVLTATSGIDPALAFVVGAIVAATDPAAVIATFKRLGVPRKLGTVVEAESLFNDGTGIVVFSIALTAVGGTFSLADGVVTFFLTVIGSVAIGLVAGWLASRIIATVDDHLIELTISLAAAYGTYLLADRLHESGIIATVVAGIVIGNYGRRIGMSKPTEDALDTVWEFIAFLLTALTFLLVGLAISPTELGDAAVAIVWGFLALLVGRAVVVYGLIGGAAAVLPGHTPLPLNWLHVLFWSGLRGAVAIALALSLPLGLEDRSVLTGAVYGIVLLTLLVQGTTAGWVLRITGVADEGRREAEAERAANEGA